jgi:hypothetical protein
MKIRIVLCNSGGELDRQIIDVGDDDGTTNISCEVKEAIETWTLRPGDTIKIVEVS